MDKITIKMNSTEARDKVFSLITNGLTYKCDDVPGGYQVEDNEIKYIGVRCEKVTLYFK